MNSIFGLHAIHAVLTTEPERIKAIHVQKDRDDARVKSLLDIAKQHHIAVVYNDKRYFQRTYPEQNTQGIVAVVTKKATITEDDLFARIEAQDKPALLLILDGVTDPHNLGACLRSADATGVDAVIAPKDRSASITPTVAKVSSGAAESVPFIQVTNLARFIEKLQSLGVWIYGLSDAATDNIYQANLTGSVALVMGAEGKGMRRLTADKCDHLLRIPMAGAVSSLNVSVATGVCLFEVVRQRQAAE